MRQARIYMVMVLALILLMGCATYNVGYVQHAYRALHISKTTYDATRDIAIGLYHRNIIDDVQRKRINQIADQYRTAHNKAVDLLKTYAATKDNADKERAEAMVFATSEALSVLVAEINRYVNEED